MLSLKYLFLTLVFLLIGWWLVASTREGLRNTDPEAIKEKLRELGGKVHSTVGIVAVAILALLLARLVTQVLRWW